MPSCSHIIQSLADNYTDDINLLNIEIDLKYYITLLPRLFLQNQ